VQASRPLSLTAAVGLVRLFEAQHTSQRRPFTVDNRRALDSPSFLPLPSLSLFRAWNPIIKCLNPAEMRARRAPRLYFNCDEKFALGHKCKRLFLIDRCYEEEEESSDEEQLAAIEEEIPEISLHAMGGTPNPQTMVAVLVDSGSTHNFLNEDVAEELGLLPTEATKFEVAVANGEKLSSKGMCKGVRIIL
jgi:hypothetical protein